MATEEDGSGLTVRRRMPSGSAQRLGNLSIYLAGTKRPLVLSVSVGNSEMMAKRVWCVPEVSISCLRLGRGVLLGSPPSSVLQNSGKGPNMNSLSQSGNVHKRILPTGKAEDPAGPL